MLEYWTGPKYDYKFPKNVQWEYKTDTDLYEFAKVRDILSIFNDINESVPHFPCDMMIMQYSMLSYPEGNAILVGRG